MNEYLVTYLSKEYFLRNGWYIVAYNPPGSQGTFTIPDPLKQTGYRGQTGSLSPDLVTLKIIDDQNHFVILEAKPSYNQPDVDKMLSMFHNPARLELFFQIVNDQCAANDIPMDSNSKNFLHFFKAHSGVPVPTDEVGTIFIEQIDELWDMENFSPDDDIYSKFKITLYGQLPEN